MITKKFEECFVMLMVHEGGFVNHPEDPAGATNWGVTKGTMQQYLGRHVSMGEMKALMKQLKLQAQGHDSRLCD